MPIGAAPPPVPPQASPSGLLTGDNASAHVEDIGLLTEEQQLPVRQAYYRALRVVWIIYVAFTGLASVLNLFVSEHHLSSDRKAAILGINRKEETDSSPRPLAGEEIPLKSSGREDTQQNKLRNRSTA
ncbi:hypothetical protein LY78DRAFT_687679 [Colletotrichum sublineola]|nr:hypothetical protein LY78DRAFT_687679 [Colletotrichum sublineola]